MLLMIIVILTITKMILTTLLLVTTIMFIWASNLIIKSVFRNILVLLILIPKLISRPAAAGWQYLVSGSVSRLYQLAAGGVEKLSEHPPYLLQICCSTNSA